VLAVAWPQPAVNGGVLHLDTVVLFGMALIFLFHGVALAPQTLQVEAAKWRVHLAIQTTTFVLFPLLVFAAGRLTRSIFEPEARLGLFFLGAVSTTISSSIALTSVARGNVAIAIFNATLSGLLGLLLTPLLMTAIGTASLYEISLPRAFARIFTLLLLPFIAGQVMRPLIGRRLQAWKSQTGMFERAVIVLIVLNAFANVTASGLWSRYDVGTLLSIAGVVALLLGIVISLTRTLSRMLRLPIADEIALVFCGSTKSLANGAPLAQILFGATAAGGLILLPLVLYHQLQLIVISWMAPRYAAGRQSRAFDGGQRR
jgi:sodium/bile acid cotransporter 7